MPRRPIVAVEGAIHQVYNLVARGAELFGEAEEVDRLAAPLREARYLVQELAIERWRIRAGELAAAAGRDEPASCDGIDAGITRSIVMVLGPGNDADAMEALTGERRVDVAALLEYFGPLKKWLDEQNRGLPIGW